MNIMKFSINFFKIFFSLSYIIFTVLFLLELILQFSPVSDSYWIQPVNEKQPIKHFKKNTTFTRQLGFRFNHVIEKKSNNFGYLTNTNFKSNDNRENELISIIGNSYVEASEVNNEDTFHGLLNNMHPKIDIYPVGTGGASLAQYLAYARFSQEIFNPDKFIFLLNRGDFAQALLKSNNSPAEHYFDDNGKIVRIDYEPSTLGKIVRLSALFRYLFIDYHLPNKFGSLSTSLKNKFIKKEKLTQNELAIYEEKKRKNEDERLSLSLKALNIFLRELSKIAKDKPVLIVLNDHLPFLYNDYKRDFSFWENKILHYIENEAAPTNNFTTLDLQGIFLKNWQENGKKFDKFGRIELAHWNKFGHRVVAESINNTSIFKNNSN